MVAGDPYISLITSLPSSERLFVAKKPPISRVRLEKRLLQLNENDAETLSRIEALLAWGSYGMGERSASIIKRVSATLPKIRQPALRQIVVERMELRSAVAALRMRRDGLEAPEGCWGFGRWRRHILANWTDRTFRLDHALPWLREAARLIEARESVELERFILGVTFKQLQRHGGNHLFDFEAVVIYVLKWSIFDRWAQTDATAAAKRFTALANDALREFPKLALEVGSS